MEKGLKDVSTESNNLAYLLEYRFATTQVDALIFKHIIKSPLLTTKKNLHIILKQGSICT